MRHSEAHFPGAKQFRLSMGARSVANIRLYERLGYMIVATEPVTDRVSVVIMTKVAQSVCAGHDHAAPLGTRQKTLEHPHARD
jgi:hypothetical protein